MTVVKEISGTLKALVERLADAVGGIAELVEEIKVQAEEDGLSAKDIRELIVSALKKKNLADRTIRNYLPNFTKDKGAQEMRGKRQQFTKETNVADDATQSEKTTTYKGDAGNDPELIKKYTDDQMQPPVPIFEKGELEKQTFTIDRKQLNKLNDIARERRALNFFKLTVADGKVTGVEA